MSAPPGYKAPAGAVSWMARNPVAANLLLLLVFLGGVINVGRVKQEVFPEFSLDLVNISVPYPGASPSEVEQGITLAIEEAIRGVDGVKKVRSSSNEGVAIVSAELLLGADPDRALQDIKNEVDRVRTLPLEAEDPQVTLATRRQRVITLVIAGDTDRHTLHDLAEHARDELLARGAATQVDVEGLPPLEIAVEVDRERLASFGLTLQDVASQITFGSLELPGGALDTPSGEILVRVADRKLTGAQLGEMVLRGTRGGAEIRLSDVATIRDDFAEDDQASYFNGKPAALVQIYRVGSETPTGIADGVKAFADEYGPTLPAGLSVTTWDDDSELLRARLDLLISNAKLGLVLVFLVLALFLDLRLAFWVSMGIPTSILGAFILFPSFGVSINMISLFALLITLGIVVDDAIVVAENFWEKRERGMAPLQAAIEGAGEMTVAVTFSVLTTVVAFAPLLVVPGVSGKIFGIIPVIVISVLLMSLLESFFILPAHLAEMGTGRHGPIGMLVRAADVPRELVSRLLDRVIAGPYDRLIRLAIDWRYVTAATAFALFMITRTFVSAGLIPFTFLPKIESDTVRASARLPYGVPIEASDQVRLALEASLQQALAEVGGTADVRGLLSNVGLGAASFGPGSGPRAAGSHLVSLEVDLLPADQRTISARALEAAWQQATPTLPGVESLTFAADLGASGGAAVDVQISHPDAAILATASEDVATQLRGYSELKNIDNTYAGGKVQLDFQLRPEARAMGLTSAELARQLRGSFFGAEAIREQRGREEIKVMVRLPKAQRVSEHDLEQLDIRTPTGGWVPLRNVATVTRGRAATSITREDGRRVVDVKAELGAGATSARPVLDALAAEGGFLQELRARYPGLRTRFAGEAETQNESLANLGQNFLLALAAIFVLLAVPFKSYTQPIIVMTAIPMGFVGAIGGHLLHGYGLSVISVMGIIAAAGVVVNDSLVMIDAANNFRETEGMTDLEAIVAAGKRRMRPILLTSLTTYAGLISMIFEKSTQARFLVPMALSLGYGVLFCTFVALLMIPAVYMIEHDLRTNLSRLWTWLYPSPPAEEFTAAPATAETGND